MKKLTLIILITVLQFLGCQSSVQPNSKSPMTEKSENKAVKKPKVIDAELERNRRLWRDKHILNYKMTITVSVGGMTPLANPVSIEVRKGNFISIEPTLKSDDRSIEIHKDYETVEKMFGKIQKGLDEKAEVEVDYDKEFGYPKKILLDYAVGYGEDAWNSVEIEKFEIIE
jgi:hypothetical protein